MMYIAVTLIAAMLLGIGFVLQQHAAEQFPARYFLQLRLIGELLRRPLWLIGIAAMIVGDLMSAWALGHLSLSVIEPLLTMNLIFALLLAVPISGEALRRTEIAGAVLLTAGVASLSVSRSVRASSMTFGSFSHWPAAAVIAGVAAILVYYGRRSHATLRATLTGTAGGLLLGISDALTRRSLEVVHSHGVAALLASWPGYALAATAAVALWLMQSAFSVGPLHASLPAVTAAEPLAGIVLGILVFGDTVHITPWLLALQAAGLAAIVGGVILVASAPVFRGLRGGRHLAHPHRGQTGDASDSQPPGTTSDSQPPGTTSDSQPPGTTSDSQPPSTTSDSQPPGTTSDSQPAGDVATPPFGESALAAASGSRLVRSWGFVVVTSGIAALRGRGRRRLT